MPRRPTPPDDVYFPVVPMLDMAFQLLAFFILTFQPPGREARIDLDLPTVPVALPAVPGVASTVTQPAQEGLPPDLIIRAESGPSGELGSVRLGQTRLSGIDPLVDLLRERVLASRGRPLTVALIADDELLYEEAAKLLGACATADVASVRLVPASSQGGATTSGEEP